MSAAINLDGKSEMYVSLYYFPNIYGSFGGRKSEDKCFYSIIINLINSKKISVNKM